MTNYEFAYPIPSKTVALTDGWAPKFSGRSSDGQRVADLAFHSTLQSIQRLHGLQDNWDGNASRKPKSKSVLSAADVARKFHLCVINSGQLWARPHISADEDGDVVFEWWSRERKLTIYVSGPKVSYIKVWGSDIDDEMEDGLVTNAGFPNLWRWLSA